MDSRLQAITRFDSPHAAKKYAAAYSEGSGTHRRELRCIMKAFVGVPAGAKVLDLPCGAGRLLPALNGAGFNVTSADSSRHMVDIVREKAAAAKIDLPAENFVVTDVSKTPFADGQFDAIICNRLFHHFRESEVRQTALRELRRICKGPIVVSFFRNFGWNAMTFRVRDFLRLRKSTDRIPISLGTFVKDIHAAGLEVTQIIGVVPGISKSWYVVLRRAD